MRLLALMYTVLALVTASAAAEDQIPTQKSEIYFEPVLITSVGQSADILIMKGLCLRAGLTAKTQPTAGIDSLEGMKTLILVAGGSSKGLGAAKIDVSGEEKRVAALISAAVKLKIPVLTFHLGGEPRRGALSDPFNAQAAKGSEYILVVGDGDNDGFFKKIAESRKARYQHIDKSIEAIEVLKGLFGKSNDSPKDQSK